MMIIIIAIYLIESKYNIIACRKIDNMIDR
jgi:hypothetical protein